MSQKLRGFVGQGMNARKSYRDARVAIIGYNAPTSGVGSVTATSPCVALIYGYGPGGSGVGDSGFSGGGGGGATYKRIHLATNQAISWSIGAPGAAVAGGVTPGNDATDTVITLPFGATLTARGGKGGAVGVPGAGGTASGGDLNRTGGAGGGASASGSSGGTGGGAGGANNGTGGGGGGGAGFSDQGLSLGGGTGGGGNKTTPAVAFGGGSGGSGAGTGSLDGAAGGVVIVLVRVS